MQTSRPFEVVFLTNFSNSSYRTVPALAQLADELDTHITIVHASQPGGFAGPVSEARLASFFPDAGTYRRSSRLNFSGDVVEAVKQLGRQQPVDLIVAPSSDPLGWPRPLHTSLRSRILRECHAPVWTIGKAIHSAVLNRRTRNVGCWVDLASPDTSHITAAFEYAGKLEANLHLLHALPEIHEGSLALPVYYGKPLSEDGAAKEIRALLGWMPVQPQIHIATGPMTRVMPSMARDLNLDAMFVSRQQALGGGWNSRGISSAIDRCNCPVFCCTPSAKAWRLRRGSRFVAQETAIAA